MPVTVTQLQRGECDIYKVSGFATNAESSDPIAILKHSDISIQAVGTFAGSIAVSVRGSNEVDKADSARTYIPLRDSNETVISFTAADLVQLLEAPVFLKFVSTAGTGGAAVDLYVKALRRR